MNAESFDIATHIIEESKYRNAEVRIENDVNTVICDKIFEMHIGYDRQNVFSISIYTKIDSEDVIIPIHLISTLFRIRFSYVAEDQIKTAIALLSEIQNGSLSMRDAYFYCIGYNSALGDWRKSN